MKRNPAALFFVAAIVAAMLFVGFHSARRAGAGGPDAMNPIGKAAPDFTLQSLEGKKVVVELRNDLIIRGTIDESDEYMK